ncbi:MAG: hypothetical protein WBV81_21130, partial [Ignavibacteriaceae bacterium]
FDMIDKNFESGLNFGELNNKEKKIRQFIIDYKLQNAKFRFSKKIRNDFLEFCGIDRRYRNNKELFKKYSRCPDDWTFLEIFINELIGSFYTFSKNYKTKNVDTNFADIEMKIKLLRMYCKVKN